MIYLGRAVCAFAKDGTCKFPPEHCRTCKIEPEDSAFHHRLCIGTLTWSDLTRMQMKNDRYENEKP